MKKFLKIAGIFLLSVIVLVTVFYFFSLYALQQRLKHEYAVTPEVFPIPNDSASILKGKHLVDIKGCSDCHGDDMGGKVFADELLLGTLAGPNLTTGAGGLSKDYPDVNWIKALKHGLKENNRPMIVIPAVETSKMSQEDMGAMVAYLKHVPPVDRTLPESKLGPMLTIMVQLDQLDVIPAEKINHETKLIKQANTSSPIEYGRYLSAMCSACHRDNMQGGGPLAPGFPPVPDLTSTGAAGKWTQQQFNNTLRTGKRPDGTALDPNMPWQMTKHYSDEELYALFEYFKTL